MVTIILIIIILTYMAIMSMVMHMGIMAVMETAAVLTGQEGEGINLGCYKTLFRG